MAEKVTVGFVGLGNMGHPMAGQLAAAGYRLLVHDANPAAVKSAQAAFSAAQPASPDEIARRCDVLILILPNGRIVRDFLVAGQGTPVIDLMRPGSVVIDMSSSAPLGTRDLGKVLAQRNIDLVDAPVSGGVARARTGKLAVMTGGDRHVVERIWPVLKVMCATHIHVGDLGAGHAMKALNNYVSAAGLTAACEALRVAQALGIDGQSAIDALNASTGRNNATENKLSQFVLSNRYDSGFSAELMNKDLATALELMEELGIESPLAKAFIPIWDAATARLGHHADHTEIGRPADERPLAKTGA